MLRLSLLVALVALSATASAQQVPCPSGASTAASIPSGATVRVVGVHPDDAYYDRASALTGTTGTATGALTNNGGCWFGGPMRGKAGDEFYFFKAALVVTGAPGPASTGTGCPSGAVRGPLRGGTPVTFLGVHPDDAYSRAINAFQPGEAMTVVRDMNQSDDCWYGGPVLHNSTELYFYKAAFSVGAPTGRPDVTIEKDPGGQIRALPNDDSLNDDLRALLVRRYDADRSSVLDTRTEVDGLTCDVLSAIDQRFRQKWSSGVRVILGFSDDFLWVGNAIGFSEGVRAHTDQRFEQCGVAL